jgi:GAF domain-containing protein
MIEGASDERLLESFANLADTLVADYDVVDLLQTLVDTCQHLLGVAAAGILLADETNQLDLVASTSEANRVVETMQLSAQSGPCIDAFVTGSLISVPDISTAQERWPDFTETASAQGFLAIVAIPLRLRTEVIGTLNLMQDQVGELSQHDRRAAQALADVATIGILHQRAFRETTVIREQLTRALDSRVLIEQAKGVVSHTSDTTPEEAFNVIRNYARSHREPLTHVAELIVQRELRL